MSAAWENAKKGWIVAAFSLCTSIIGVVVSQNLSDNSINKRQAEEDKKEFQLELDAKLEKKADKTWVIEQVSTVEAKSAITDTWVKDMLNKIYQQNVDNTKRIDDFIKASK